MDAALQELLLSSSDTEKTTELAAILESLRKTLRFRILAPSAEVRKFTESTIQVCEIFIEISTYSRIASS